MDCPELDALAMELQARLHCGAFRWLSPVTLDGGQVVDAELMARIVLADIKDLCDWYPTRPTHPFREETTASCRNGCPAAPAIGAGTSVTVPGPNLSLCIEPAV
jgi:hypothetical protein